MSVTSTLALEVGLFNGASRLVRSRQQFPQRVTVPMYLDTERSIAYLCVQNPAAGIFPGDLFRAEVRLTENAGLHLTGAAATQVFAKPDRTAQSSQIARQEYAFDLAAGSYLEQMPKRTIPHAGAGFGQQTKVLMHPTATYVGWECVASGRVGHGERNSYREYNACTEIEVGGQLVAKEALALRPERHRPASRGALADHDYLGTFTVAAPAADVDGLASRLIDTASRMGSGDIVAAASPLPSGTGVICRVLARRAPALDRFVHALLADTRAALTGSALPAMRM